MANQHLFLIQMFSLLLFSIACNSTGEKWQVSSPDENITVSVYTNPTDSSVAYHVSYASERGSVRALDTSALGLVMEDMDFSSGLKFTSASYQEVKEDYFTVTGKRINDINYYNEMKLVFKNSSEKPFEILFRAYNDGLAFRYNIPDSDGEVHTITDELSSFNLSTTGGKAWMQHYDTLRHWGLAYELPYHNEIPIGTTAEVSYGWALPLLFEKPDGLWMLISEADLDESYCGMHVKKDAPNGHYSLAFPEAYESYGNFDQYPKSTFPWQTPWRFAIISPDLGGIVESNLVNHLSPPAAFDTDWIKPGIASWSWWSDPTSSRDYIPLKDFVDLSNEMGWEYSLVDADWDIMKNGNIDQLIDYADQKDVGLFLWYNSGGPNNLVMYEFTIKEDTLASLAKRKVPEQVIEKLRSITNQFVFAEDEYREKLKNLLGGQDYQQYGEKIILASTFRNARPRDRLFEPEVRAREMKELAEKGVKGIKVDFFASDKQEVIQLYLGIIKEAAKNQILVNTHGCTIPRGWSKTYPNLLTMESVMGAEMYGTDSWAELAPVQNAVYPFLRNVIGPMDYTPVTFSTRQGGYPHLTTDAHELALSVLYETGLLHVAESADYLRKASAEVRDFLKNVPVIWDDVEFISGYPGEYCILVRKLGNQFYVAGINGTKEEKTVSFKTSSFLTKDNYTADYYLDDQDGSIAFEIAQSSGNDTVYVTMQPLGGFVVVLK